MGEGYRIETDNKVTVKMYEQDLESEHWKHEFWVLSLIIFIFIKHAGLNSCTF